ncbi:sulfatase-like hydrolase/transferase [Stieleria marina]|uniref:Arylsulfatase n=1 Tax=Stieleria marina TaxID=1930275 RepID=A0A517P0I7_9BACT|nr:Arylsulfatase [Planctomycetes bacterium K23_9]
MIPFVRRCSFALITLVIVSSTMADATSAKRPNVIVVITDDQGYGEFSAHGNPILQTPNLDRLASQSVRLTDFHVAPMCTPTRGQLMTGVDAFRNGAMNVSSGRTLLRRELPTLGNVFADAGYRTGLFGKWHLGDTYPYRPQDRGFRETLWFPSSHIGSVPDQWQNDYFDDTYIHNGKQQAYSGYTTDVLFDEAMSWMHDEAEAERPFLCYLATAAAHQPHYVPQKYIAEIRESLRAAASDLPNRDLPDLAPEVEEQLIRFLAMCVNIDENVGRLETFLTQHQLRENTVVVFLTDNGSTFGPRYFNANMKGGKTTLWEGGHRVPCFIRWPAGGLQSPQDVTGLTQVQDLLPTLVDLLGLPASSVGHCDGISLAPILCGDTEVPTERMLVINYSRMPFKTMRTTPMNPAVPRRERAAVLWKSWRLLEDKALYDLNSDPLQQDNVIDRHPAVVAAMRSHLNDWWDGVKLPAREFQPSVIGHKAQNPVELTACEWADVFVDQQSQVRRGVRKNGLWHIEVAEAGKYAFTLSRWPQNSGLRLRDRVGETKVTDGMLTAGPAWPVTSAAIRVGDIEQRTEVNADASSARFELSLPVGRTTMQTWFHDSEETPISGAYYVNVQRLNPAAPVKLILDTDMSGDCDDVGALALLHALADRGECELLATLLNRRDLTNASAAATDAINTWYGRPDIPIGTDKTSPIALQRTSSYTRALRDGFPNDIGPDDKAPDALDVYRHVLADQPDHSVTICSIGAFSNLAELCRHDSELVRRKVRRLVVMGGAFPQSNKPETNVATHVAAARFVADQWPGKMVWHGFEVGNVLITGAQLKQMPNDNPIRKAYELRPYAGRRAIDQGQPSYDQAAALFAAHDAEPAFWKTVAGGHVRVDQDGQTRWHANEAGKHSYVELISPPKKLAAVIESLMTASPKLQAIADQP